MSPIRIVDGTWPSFSPISPAGDCDAPVPECGPGPGVRDRGDITGARARGKAQLDRARETRDTGTTHAQPVTRWQHTLWVYTRGYGKCFDVAKNGVMNQNCTKLSYIIMDPLCPEVKFPRFYCLPILWFCWFWFCKMSSCTWPHC